MLNPAYLTQFDRITEKSFLPHTNDEVPVPRRNPPVGFVFYNDDVPSEICTVTRVAMRGNTGPWVFLTTDGVHEDGSYHAGEWASDEYWVHLHGVHDPTA